MMNRECIATDVLIAGGGTSGCNAAIAAAREGAAVLLVEMDDAVGGVATRSNVSGYHFGSRGGLQDEVDRQVMARQRVFGGRDSLSHPEAKRSVYSELLHKHGVQVLLGHICCEVIKDNGKVVGIVAAGPNGLLEIRAKVTVDCTSEGDVSAAAGAAFTMGRAFDGVTHAYSLTPRIIDEHPKTGEPQISLRNFDAGWVQSISVKDVSRAYREGREYLLTFLTTGNGIGRHLLSIAPKLGVREGRHIVGDYQMVIDDFLHDRRFEDVICRSYSHYDTHARDLGNESDFAQIWLIVLDMFKKGGFWCDVPYRSLLPQGVDGLLVASRALSVDRDVSMAVRMQRDIQKIGEAAGVAAAISAMHGIEPRQIDVKELQSRLLAYGVLKENDLTRTTTANLMFNSGPLAKQPLSLEVGMTEEEGKRFARQLCDYLGTEEEEVAVWWLRKLGDAAIDPLTDVLRQSEDYARRRIAAFALALLGSKDAIPMLLEVLRTRDDSRRDHPRSLPRWVAALVLLRLLECGEGADAALDALEENHSAGISSNILQYLYHICGDMDVNERSNLMERLKRWLSSPEAGSYYTPANSNAVLHIRWIAAFWVGMILAKCGDRSAPEYCMSYLSDSNEIIRQAAKKALRTITQHLGIVEEQEGGISHGQYKI